MSKRSIYHEKLDKVLDFMKLADDEETVEVVLEEKVLEDGTRISYENLEVGTPVFVLVEGEDPMPLADGEYKISDTEVLVVLDGMVSEVKAMDAEPSEEVVEPVVAEANASSIFNLEALGQKIDMTKDGIHTLSVLVTNGNIDSVVIESNSYQELSEQVKSQKVKLAEAKTIQEELVQVKAELETAKLKFEQDLKILGETVNEQTIVQAPTESKTTPLTPKERKIAFIMEQRKELLEN